MTAELDDNANIYTYQGDTILLNIDNLPVDLPYIIYWSVRDLSSNEDIITQIPFLPIGDTVQINIPPTITDALYVPSGKKYKDYRWCAKACNADNNIEHTLIPDGKQIGVETILRVYRKQSEGTIN